MKIFKIIIPFTLLVILCSSCNRNVPDDLEGQGSDMHLTATYKWWILTHKNYQKPGIYLYNEQTGAIEVELKLPKGLQSPHALAYDGASLWVGGIGENESIYQLDPVSGDVLSEIPNIITEGLAIQDEYIYYSSENAIHKIMKNGTVVESIQTENTALNISDIAISENLLYYLRYAETGPIVKLNLTSKSETPINTVETSGTYCLSFVENKLVTVSNLNEINQNSSRTGELISSTPTGIEGWITAIALHEKIE
ncbi:DUF5050 domain-containing protein [Pseudotamlana agarivorans]|uniref:DUF5050 domain-containing protein n=1 Tax=Pseudotamlana agarivorans TaxID=481183 RepID=UPI000AD88F62|nr:DUF5050 domain-containing protein [Tamlana agarivorans]